MPSETINLTGTNNWIRDSKFVIVELERTSVGRRRGGGGNGSAEGFIRPLIPYVDFLAHSFITALTSCWG